MLKRTFNILASRQNMDLFLHGTLMHPQTQYRLNQIFEDLKRTTCTGYTVTIVRWHAYVWVSVYVFVCVLSICIYECAYVCEYVDMCEYVCVCVVSMYICESESLGVYVCDSVSLCVNMWVHICMNMCHVWVCMCLCMESFFVCCNS